MSDDPYFLYKVSIYHRDVCNQLTGTFIQPAG